MKKIFTAMMLMLCALSGWAQRIDFNYAASYREDVDLEYGYVNWAIGRQKGSATETFLAINGDDTCHVTITISNIDELQGNGMQTNWWKTGLRNNGYRLIGDMVINGTVNDDGNFVNITSGSSGIQLAVKGLAAGDHTLMAYHSNTDNNGENISPLDVYVNGVVVAEGVKQRSRGIKPSECPFSYIHFTVKDTTETTIIRYITKPAADQTYASTAVSLNALVFDEANPLTQSHDPYPVNKNMHVDADNGTCMLQWSAAKTAAKHHLYFGTASGQEAEVATLALADTCYEVKDLYSMNTYYWRVDEEDETGKITEGEEWSFRPRQLAFPGAEGYGRFAQGGRGGVVYHVTNLSNDMEPGSFIYGLNGMEGPRTIVFDVSGIIQMSEKPTENMPSCFANPYVTIAAQTAPGKGICLRYCNLGIGEESIVRHLRAKRGFGAEGVTGNAIGLNTNNSILDHVTAAWGTDETFSSRGAKNITFQYSMIAEALGITGHKNYSAGVNHGYAATIDGKIGTYSHNMLVNCEGRNWSLGGGMDGTNTAIGQMDIFNNVCYNWYGRTTDGGCHEVNFVNNYYKMGPDTKKTILFSQDYENIGSIQSTWQAYISGNIRENKNHTLTTDMLGDTYQYTLSNGAVDPNKRTDEYKYQTFVNKPFFESYATIHTAKEAFKIVTSTSGATMPCRDNQHKRVMDETIKGTYTYVGSKSGIKGEIDREFDITAEAATQGWEVWPEESRAADFDTDQDGMPNWYEQVIGSDPNTANNNDDPDHDGWTLLEDYLDFMAHPYVIVAPGQSATFDCAPEFVGFTKSPVFSVSTDSNLFTASVSGSTITVNASQNGGVGTVNMTVTDGDGTTYTQRLNVAVTGEATAIPHLFDDTILDGARKEFFTLDGKQVTTLQHHGTYLLRLTTKDGTVRSMKIIAD